MPSPLQLQTYTTSSNPNTSSTTTSTTICDRICSHKTMRPKLPQELSKQLSLKEMNLIATYHNHQIRPNQCYSVVVHHIAAPITTVWSLVRRFDEPQTYKHFLRSCRVIAGDGGEVGCLREVHVISGIPAVKSTERLEVLDDESHAIGFSVVKGEHRLQNYRSVTTLHPSQSSGPGSGLGSGSGTVVVESYVVDVPPGNTKEETCVFVDTIVRCNLQSLTKIAENMATSKSNSSQSSASSSSSSSCKVS